jgi:hypothetical protein
MTRPACRTLDPAPSQAAYCLFKKKRDTKTGMLHSDESH